MKHFERPIFILGLRRTGSTLWHNIIAMDETICRLTEMMFLEPWHKDFRFFLRKYGANLNNEIGVAKMVDLMLSKNSIEGLNSAFWKFDIVKAAKKKGFREQLIKRIYKSNKSIKSIFKATIEEVTFASGYNRCCVKFPTWVNHISELMEWYPDCKIIHITRDVRATAISKTGDPSGTALKVKRHPSLGFLLRKFMMMQVAIQYYWSSLIHNSYKNHSNYALFKYEDLLQDPNTTIKTLCEFIKIDFNESMLLLEQGRHEHQPSSITGMRKKSIDRLAASRWMEVISSVDKFWLTLITRGSMKRLDFNPEQHPIYLKTVA